MCGRYFIDVDSKEFQRIIREAEQNSKQTVKTGEIFPTNIAPVLLNESNSLVPHVMKWGFPRFGSKGSIINARIETILEKPTFKKSTLERRCIIPTSGFYEWRQEESSKVKYYFQEPNSDIVYIAGIYNSFKKNGTAEQCFTILTTAPNEFMSDYHMRMPVILNNKTSDVWLSESFDLTMLSDQASTELMSKAAN